MSKFHVHMHRIFLMGCIVVTTGWVQAQEEAKKEAAPEEQLPKISDEPKLIDPATVMPAKLAAPATVDLSESSLREVIEWLRKDRKLVVLTERNALSEVGLQAGEPVSDRLDNAPLYLLLNRLRSNGLAWYFEDDVLHLTSIEAAEQRLTTIPYNLGDLLDAGYEMSELTTVIENAIEPETWESVGGVGVLSFLGDVMFVRHTDQIHRKTQGLLAALRKHGRQTFVLDPPQHLALRQKLAADATVDFQDMPLDAAVKALAAKLKIDVRLDIPALRGVRVRERQPVTLKLAERKLSTVLHALVADFDLTWVLRDGVLWITSQESAESLLKTAVYDVRDLCRDDAESEALREAVMSQTTSAWDDTGGPGTIHFAQPGTLVIHNQENIHAEVMKLLETYRTALRASKPRDRHAVDPQEVITVYYRLHTNVAQDLDALLPTLVQPKTWQSETQPDAKGSIIRVASNPELFTSEGQAARATSKETTESVVVARSVLIIRQAREVHDQIEEVIQRVESGDVKESEGVLGGLGGGGFGGGFFSLPTHRPAKQRDRGAKPGRGR